MKLSKDRALLAVVPLIILLLSLLYADKGPYYFGNNSDPEYCYLFNSLNILHLKRPYHTDHPGTPLQVLGAVIILGKGIVQNWTMSISVIRASVLHDPEDYLRAMNVVLNILICATTFWAGVRLFNQTKRLFPPLILQFSLLCFFEVQICLSRVSPEPFQVLAILLLAPLLFAEVLADEGESAGHAGRMRPFMTGAVLGLGLAAKVTLFPLLFLLFVFEGPRRKATAAAGCFLSFLVFTLPILPSYARMFQWFADVLLHEGYYGAGAVGLPALGTLLSNAKELSLSEPLLPASLAWYAIGALLIKKGKSARTARSDTRIQSLLWAGSLIILVQIAITSKHPRPHYLLPALVVSCIMNAGLIYALLNTGDRRRKIISIMFVMALFIGCAFTGARIHAWIEENKQYVSTTEDLLARAQSIDRAYTVGFYRSSLPQYALAFGNDFAGRLYGQELARLYPDTILYQVWQDFFYTFDGRVINPYYMQGLIDSGEGFIMVGTPDRLNDKEWIVTEPLFRNSQEGIFRLVGFK